MILHVFIKLWVLFNISLLQYQIFALLLIEYVSLCILLHIYSHWAIVRHILRYLKGTITNDLHITHSSSFALHGFIDMDWTSNIDDRKSISGYLVFFGQTPNSWKLGKETYSCLLLY